MFAGTRPSWSIRSAAAASIAMLLLTGCNAFPSDPGAPALGLSRAGQDLVAWIPPCPGERPADAHVSTLDEAEGVTIEGEEVWSGRFTTANAKVPQELSASNPNLAQVRGSYHDLARVMVVIAGGVRYQAVAAVAALPSDAVWFRGQVMTPAEFNEASLDECS